MCSVKSNLSLNIPTSSSSKRCCCLCSTIPSTSTNLQSCLPNSKIVNCNLLNKHTPSTTINSNILSGLRRHTVSNPTEASIKTNRLRRKVSAYSLSGDLAAAADSYFYFYSLGDNSVKKSQNFTSTNTLKLQFQNSSQHKIYNEKYLKSYNFYSGSNYHEFRNKFITIRLCENCQKMRNLNEVDFNSNYYFCGKKFSYEDTKEDQFSQVSTIQIVDFSSNSSLLTSTPSTSLSECNSFQSSLQNISDDLTQKTEKHLPNQHVTNDIINLFNESKFKFNKNFIKKKNKCFLFQNCRIFVYQLKLFYVLF